MSAANLVMSAAGGTVAKTYVDDVFQVVTRTGTGATATINCGIDLSTNGGLVWTKGRTSATAHYLSDTAQGTQYYLQSNATSARSTGNFVTATTTGFSWAGAAWGDSGIGMVDWVFRKAPKFFDVVTYTGDGTSSRQIPHSLGIAPGMIIVKITSTTSQWYVYHVGAGNSKSLYLNLTDAVATTAGNPWTPTATTFTVDSSGNCNASGFSYVAYLFAHDTSTDGMIQCGTFTTDGSGNATVNLGWEPQYLMCKSSNNATDNWLVSDSMRGALPADGTSARLYANISNAEAIASSDVAFANATGFSVARPTFASKTYIYLAIRRPNKPPTTGTQVYNAIARTGTGAAATVTGVGFAPDLAFTCNRAGASTNAMDRLRGSTQVLSTPFTTAEGAVAQGITAFGVDGAVFGTDGLANGSGASYINHFFRRAPGFMDVCAYTGTGSATTVAHGLGVVPELIIFKVRSATAKWHVYHAATGAGGYCELNTTNAFQADTTAFMNNTAPTASVFSLGTYTGVSPFTHVNDSGHTYVAYLFSTLPGISKVGGYTGNGSSQTINCGFTTGARFVLIKATSTTGNWYVFDTVRGIVAGSENPLELNLTVAETYYAGDSIDPDTSGFIVNQLAGNTEVNTSGVSYIFLAIS